MGWLAVRLLSPQHPAAVSPSAQGPGLSLTCPRQQSLSQPERVRAARAGRQPVSPACLTALNPHPAATSPPISCGVRLGLMCLYVSQLCSFQSSGASVCCIQGKSLSFLADTLPLNCRMHITVCARGSGLGVCLLHVSELALPLLIPVEGKAAPGNMQGCCTP